LQFNRFAIAAGFASLAIVAVYPFMKRITYWPQIFLGLAFSWGALMGWAAAFGRLDASAYLLYAGAIAWVIAYDTIYAHQDREDDALVGLKSTALLFGDNTRPMLAAFYAAAVVLIALAQSSAGCGPLSYLGLAAFAVHLSWQVLRFQAGNPALCLRLFKSNRDAPPGLIAATRRAQSPDQRRGRYVDHDPSGRRQRGSPAAARHRTHAGCASIYPTIRRHHPLSHCPIGGGICP
jgi:4-hydroxybenzoate polyprenyltransferase